jgi:hypothetical protein
MGGFQNSPDSGRSRFLEEVWKHVGMKNSGRPDLESELKLKWIFAPFFHNPYYQKPHDRNFKLRLRTTAEVR